jgi:hypothetical protein
MARQLNKPKPEAAEGQLNYLKNVSNLRTSIQLFRERIRKSGVPSPEVDRQLGDSIVNIIRTHKKIN